MICNFSSPEGKHVSFPSGTNPTRFRWVVGYKYLQPTWSVAKLAKCPLGGATKTPKFVKIFFAGRCPAPRWGSAPDPAEAKPQSTICISGAPEPVISNFWLAKHDDF